MAGLWGSIIIEKVSAMLHVGLEDFTGCGYLSTDDSPLSTEPLIVPQPLFVWILAMKRINTKTYGFQDYCRHQN